MSDQPLRRFYKEAGVMEDAEGFGVVLDGRGLKTQSGANFRTPTRPLAQACAKEWAAQDKHILPHTMPMTRFANVAIDVTRQRRADTVDFVIGYIGTDLCCYRAESPAALAARQAHAWDPILAWAQETHGLAPKVVTGILAAEEGEAPARLKAHAETLDDFALTGLAHATGMAGSAVIGLALAAGRLDAASAFEAAALDDLWSLESWGEDAEARARLDRLKADFETAARFFTLLA